MATGARKAAPSAGLVIRTTGGRLVGGGGGGWVFDNQGKRLKQFAGPGGRDHQLNFIQAVRSRKPSDLNGNIEECHYSSSLCHMANISYRLGQKSAPAEIKERLQSNPPAQEAFDRFLGHLKANEIDTVKNLAALGPTLTMDNPTERFTGEGSDMANLLIRRQYREPFVIRDQV